METGIELIKTERERQVSQEGWTPQHDEQHDSGELALAACCYSSPVLLLKPKGKHGYIDPWPWYDTVECTRYGDGTTFQEPAWDKRQRDNDDEIIPNGELPTAQRIRNLVKAGALIAAEIDRLEHARFKRLVESAEKQPKGSFLNP